jgi:hypothetical protein
MGRKVISTDIFFQSDRPDAVPDIMSDMNIHRRGDLMTGDDATVGTI